MEHRGRRHRGSTAPNHTNDNNAKPSHAQPPPTSHFCAVPDGGALAQGHVTHNRRRRRHKRVRAVCELLPLERRHTGAWHHCGQSRGRSIVSADPSRASPHSIKGSPRWRCKATGSAAVGPRAGPARRPTCTPPTAEGQGPRPSAATADRSRPAPRAHLHFSVYASSPWKATPSLSSRWPSFRRRGPKVAKLIAGGTAADYNTGGTTGVSVFVEGPSLWVSGGLGACALPGAHPSCGLAGLPCPGNRCGGRPWRGAPSLPGMLLAC